MNIEIDDEQKYSICKATLISDYLRILGDPVEHPPGIETNSRLAAFWELLGYYCTAKEKESLCKWWMHGKVELSTTKENHHAKA